MLYTYIAVMAILILAAIIINWQSDKSSFAGAFKSHWIKYLGMGFGGWFLVGYLLGLEYVRLVVACLAAIAIYFFWTAIYKGILSLINRKSATK